MIQTAEETAQVMIREVEQAMREKMYGKITFHFENGEATRFVREKSVRLK